jgi:hypothetical protein
MAGKMVETNDTATTTSLQAVDESAEDDARKRRESKQLTLQEDRSINNIWFPRWLALVTIKMRRLIHLCQGTVTVIQAKSPF